MAYKVKRHHKAGVRSSTFVHTVAALLFLVGRAFGSADLVPTRFQVPAILTNSPLPQVYIKWTVTNQGDTAAAGFTDAIYISTNATLDSNTPLISGWYVSAGLAPGASYSRAEAFQLPIGYSGQYYLFFKTDISNSAAESDDSNNTVVAPLAFQAVSSDLAIGAVVVPSNPNVPRNPYFKVAWSVTNLGPGNATASWSDTVYLSTSAVLDTNAIPLGTFYRGTPLPAGQVHWQTNDLWTPITTNGNYFLIFETDVHNTLYELNLSNNSVSVPISLAIKQPDLAALPLQVPTNLSSLAYPSLPIVWAVTNSGPVVAQGSWYDLLFLSTNAVLDAVGDTFLGRGEESGPILPGSSYFRTNSVRIPVRQSGTYYLIFRADLGNALDESSVSNNLSVQAITLDIQQPDLTPVSFQVPTAVTSSPNPVLKLSWGVTNQGNGSTSGYWYDRVYFSTLPILDSSATQIFGTVEDYPIYPGEEYWRTNNVPIPVTQGGTYYLFFRTDDGNGLNESDTLNNTVVRPITFTIQPPNLSPVTLQVASPITSSPNPMVRLVWAVTNSGTGTAGGNWYDKVYFSTNSQFDPSDFQVISDYRYGPISPGGSYWRTNIAQLPVTQSGIDYLIFFVNSDSYTRIFESDYSDNSLIVPVTFNISPPDLVPIVSQLPHNIVGPPYPMATVVWGVTNQGTGIAQGNWNDGLFLALGQNLYPSDPMVAPSFEYRPIPPGGVVWFTNSVTLPVTSSGTRYFAVQANSYNALFESNYSNNVAVAPVSFEIQPPDLAPIGLQAPKVINSAPFPSIEVTWGVTNQGTGDALGPYTWFDHLYVSTNATWDLTAIDVFSLSEHGPIAPNHTYWRTNLLQLPIFTSGNYYLFFRANSYNELVESDYSNNTAQIAFNYKVQPLDLAVVGVQVPSSVTGPPNPTLTYVWGVTNQGSGSAKPFYASWSDSVSFSVYGFPNPTDYMLSVNYQNGPLPAGDVYWQTNTVRIPVTQSGTYYLIFNTDQSQTLIESDYENNIAAVPVTFTIQPPDLAPLALIAPSALITPPNPTLAVVWGVTNQGIGQVSALDSWNDQLYLSSDALLDSQDYYIGNHSWFGPVQPGDVYFWTNNVRLPVTQSGTYYLILRVDDGAQLLESNEANNTMAVPITLEIQPPDLLPVPPAQPLTITGPPNPYFTLTWGVTNQGSGQAVPTWYDTVYFSKNSKWGPQDPQLAFAQETVPIDPGGVARQTNSASAPIVDSGTYYLIFNVNSGGGNYLFESDYSNNVAVVPISFNIQRPDLAPLALQLPTQLTTTPNPFLTFVWGITNQGLGLAAAPYTPNWTDVLSVSTNKVLDDSAQTVFTDYSHDSLPAGASYWRTNSIQVPITQSGTYYFSLQTDANGFLFESDYNNNTLTIPITFTILPPDLAPVALLASTVVTSTPNPQLSIVWGVTNQGIGAAVGSWYDEIYLSTNSTLDETATPVWYRNQNGPVAPSSAYWSTNLLDLPVVQSGDYYIFFKANSYGNLFESDFNNNLLSILLTFTILPPDLAPIALKAPAVVTASPNSSIYLEWGVTNRGSGAARLNGGSWTDRIYLSVNPTLSIGESWELTRQFEQGPVGLAGQYWHSEWVRIPVNMDGKYYLIFQTDADHALYESDEGNNSVAVPITVKLQTPDLAPLALQAPSTVTGSANPTVRFTWGVTNQGAGAVVTPWQDTIYLSKGPTLDSSDTLIGGQWQRGALPAGSSYWTSQTMQVPVTTSGDYYLILQTGAGNSVGESNVNNNTLAVPISFHLLAPDLAVVAFEAPAELTGSANPALTLIWGVTNRGPGIATNSNSSFYWYDRVYFSSNPTLDTQNDSLVFTDYSPTPLAPGEIYWRTNIVHVPAASDGIYYLHFQANADPYRPVFEFNYTNNVASVPITFHLAPPDLAAISLKGPTNLSGPALQQLSFIWGVTNQGMGLANGTSGPWSDYLKLAKFNPSDGSELLITVWNFFQTNPVGPGQSYWATNTILFPGADPGIYRLTLLADALNDLGEVNISNNAVSIDISVHLAPPDITSIGFSSPSSVTSPPNPLVTIVWGATNQSVSAALPGYRPWVDRLYLSTNAVYDESAIFLREWEQTSLIPAEGSYWRTNTVQLPVQSSGKYYLILQLDVFRTLNEDNETNNFASFPIAVSLLPPADLKPLAFQVPASIDGPPNSPITIVWAVTNQGLGSAQSFSGWVDQLFVSSSAEPNGIRTLIASRNETNQIAPGGVYWRTNTFTPPMPASGTYYFSLSANVYGDLVESDYGNNSITVPATVNILPPDLAPLALQAPSAISGPPNPMVGVVIGITNQGPGTALPGVDALYISATPFLDSSAQVAAYLNRTNTIPPGGSYWITNSVNLPAIDSGNYYLLIVADLDNVLGEFELLNNLLIKPIRLDLSLQPDLVLHELQYPQVVTGPPNPRVQLVWHVINEGLGPAITPWSDRVVVYTNSNLGFPLPSISSPNSLPVGMGYWQTNNVRLPASLSGTYNLSLDINAGSDLAELDYGNNHQWIPITVIITNVAPVVVKAGQFLDDGAFRIGVSGTPGAAYTLQSSTNLIDWTRVMDFTCTNLLTWVVDPRASRFDQQFYRVTLYDAGATTPLVLDFAPLQSSPASGLQLELDAPLSGNYRVQRSTNLFNWNDLTNFPNTQISPVRFRDAGAAGETRLFYRAVSP